MARRGISPDRVREASNINVKHLECSICRNVLWQPVACQLCETPFCSACIQQWLNTNPNKCPYRCVGYTERKCPPFIARLLSELQISCIYQAKGCDQVTSYEALDKHEIECIYQPEQCPACQSEVLRKDFENHKQDCAAMSVTCEDCKLVYRRGDAGTRHTENICFKEQLRQLRNESNDKDRVIQEVTLQLNQLRTWRNRMSQEVTIKFNDIPDATEKSRPIPNMYKGVKWTGFMYTHESFLKNNHPKSGYIPCLIPNGSPHIAFFKKEASISVEHLGKTLTLVSFNACAAWNDNLQLNITGYRNNIQINTHTTILLFGKPQLIFLQWANIDKVTFIPSGGTKHPRTGASAGLHVVITQLTVRSEN